jgi:hypothetical protein
MKWLGLLFMYIHKENRNKLGLNHFLFAENNDVKVTLDNNS